MSTLRWRAGRPRRLVVEPDGAADRTVGDRRAGGGGQPLAEGAALVGLDVTEGDPAQPADVQDTGHCLGDGREQRTLAAVEEQRLLRVHQELVEGEAARAHRRQEGGQPVDSLGDLVDPRLHQRLPLGRGFCGPWYPVSTPHDRTPGKPGLVAGMSR